MKELLLVVVCTNLWITTYAQTTKESHEEIFDIAYVLNSNGTDDSLQMLNLVLPKSSVNAPLLIWIGGGAWSYVDRNTEMDLARKFADQGIAVASVGHRLSTAIWRDSSMNVGIKHPKHVEDVAAAIKWLYDQAGAYGYSKTQIYIGGFSSGAHLAVLVSLDPQYLAKHKLTPSIIKGIIPIGGTYDISDYHQAFVNGSRPELAELHVKAVFGETEKDFSEASVTSYLDNLSAPILLMSDRNMTNYTRLFEDAINATSFQRLQVSYDSLSHADLWRNMSTAEKSPRRDEVVDFILKGPDL